VIATGAISLALVIGLGAATSFWLREREANRRTQTTRAQAEKLINLLLQDVRPSLEQFGRVPVLDRFAEETARYYEDLPEELRDGSYAGNRAAALGILAWVYFRHADGPATARAAAEAAKWRQRVLEDSPEEFRRVAPFLPLSPNLPPSISVAKENIERLRTLLKAHPDDIYVAKELASEVGGLGNLIQDSEATPLAGMNEFVEARNLLQQVMKGKPDDAYFRTAHASALESIAWSFHLCGKYEKALEAAQQAVNFLEEAYAAGPGNLLVLTNLANAHQTLAHNWASLSLEKARDEERIAHACYEKLLLLDPAHGEARELTNFTHSLEAWYLLHNGNFEESRQLFAQMVAQYEAYRAWGVSNTMMVPWLHVDQAESAAAEGNLAEAMAQAEVARIDFEARIAKAPEGDDHNFIQIEAHTALATAFACIGDCARVQTHATVVQTVADEFARAAKDDSQLRLERGLARSFLGLARLRQDDATEAIVRLREAVAFLRDALAPPHPFGTREGWLADASGSRGDIHSRTVM
jgi:tetratricopeptide (TPR) repeat protein